MKLLALIASILLLFTNAVADDLNRFKGLKGHISIAGGTAHLTLMYELKHKIEQTNPNIHVLVRSGGSTIGIEQVGKGLIDIGNAGRQLRPKEKSYNLRQIPIAIDAIVAVVHPSNPVSNLDIETLRKIFSGEITNWKQIGGNDAPISLFDRQVGSGTRAVFIKKVMGKTAITKPDLIIEDHDKMKVVVSWKKTGIGYMSFGHVERSKVKPLAINGIEATRDTARSGKYPLAREIFMYVPADVTKMSELTKRFIDLVLSRTGSMVINRNGYIPLSKTSAGIQGSQ